jgi:hypothetical protein
VVNHGAFDIFDVKNELQQTFQDRMRVIDYILVADDVNWDFGVRPEFVEVIPYSYILLNKLGPQLRERKVVVIVYRSIMRSGANHVEQGRDRVDRVTHQQNGSLSIKLGLAVAFRVVSFDNHDALVNQSLAS